MDVHKFFTYHRRLVRPDVVGLERLPRRAGWEGEGGDGDFEGLGLGGRIDHEHGGRARIERPARVHQPPQTTCQHTGAFEDNP